MAREMGAFALNCNLRWFLPPEAGLAYEAHLKEHFGLRSSGAWRGWVSDRPDHDYRPAASCFMPFYWARVASNGDLIYCPGHPDSWANACPSATAVAGST